MARNSENIVDAISNVRLIIDGQGEVIQQIAAALEGKTVASPILQEKTVTPNAVTQTITADSGYDGLSKITIQGDSNLIADNIKADTEIFGVTGTYEGSGGSTNFVTGDITCDGRSYTYEIDCSFEPKYAMFIGDASNIANNQETVFAVYFDVSNLSGIYMDGMSGTGGMRYFVISDNTPPFFYINGNTLVFDVGGSGYGDLAGMTYHYVVWGD